MRIFTFKFLVIFTLLSFPLVGFSYNDSDLQKLKLTKNCVNCNLSSVNLRGLYFIRSIINESDLSKANLIEVDFTGSVLTNTNFSEANLIGAKLFKADLSGSNLKNAKLNKVNFISANLKGVDLTGADITGADFKNAEMDETTILTNIKFNDGHIDMFGFPPQLYKELEIQRIKNLEQEKIVNQIKDKKNKQEFEKHNKQRLLDIKSNPGFRNLVPGMIEKELKEANCTPSLLSGFEAKCYGIDNLKFKGKFNKKFGKGKEILTVLTIDMGPVVGLGFLDNLSEIIGSSENIYVKMYNTLKSKYKIEYEYSERDRQLFNEGEKEKLLIVFLNGQVTLNLFRKEKGFSRDLWLYIEYRDVENGLKHLEKNRPKRASSNDF